MVYVDAMTEIFIPPNSNIKTIIPPNVIVLRGWSTWEVIRS